MSAVTFPHQVSLVHELKYPEPEIHSGFFLLLLLFLKIKVLQQLESANSLVENTSCSSLAILALWGFLSNMNRYDSEDRGRTTMLCRKLKNGFFTIFLGQHQSQAALPALIFLTPALFFFFYPS